VEAIHRLRDPQQVPLLSQALTRLLQGKAWSAFQTIGAWRDPHYRHLLPPLINDPNPYVRQEAKHALHRMEQARG
jgi:hypothetical protein